MAFEWFRPRGYRHFDAPVGIKYAEGVCNPLFVKAHSWLPLIHYVKSEKRYKAKENKTIYKHRDIMYSSHRDACILSKYASEINSALDVVYDELGLTTNVIAYRRLGRSNYNFSADAYRFAVSNKPCVVLCFDVTGFFDSLDHAILKTRLKDILDVKELSEDWYAVFRYVTKFGFIDRDALKAHPEFAAQMRGAARAPIAKISEVITAGIPIHRNKNIFGIPQGTPISAALSNLYMIDVDRVMVDICAKIGALYQRYSDDILLICPLDAEVAVYNRLIECLSMHKLSLKEEKTERAIFDEKSKDIFQYLGFNMSMEGAVIRPSSLARFLRKAKYSIKKTKKLGEEAIARGDSTKIFTKRLRRRFQPVGARNFSKYARRAAKAFGSRRIIRQVLKFERELDKNIRDL